MNEERKPFKSYVVIWADDAGTHTETFNEGADVIRAIAYRGTTKLILRITVNEHNNEFLVESMEPCLNGGTLQLLGRLCEYVRLEPLH